MATVIDSGELRLSKLTAFNAADRLQEGRISVAELLDRTRRPE